MKKEYSIGEICELYNLGRDSLRYYEKKGLIAPKRRDNGYRVYDLGDIWRLNIIKDLRKLNFSTDQIKYYLENRNLENTLDLIRKEINLIEREIDPLLKLKGDLKNKLAKLEDLKDFSTYNEIQVREIPERKILFIKGKMTLDEEVDLAFRHLESKDDTNLSLFANRDMGVFISKSSLLNKDYRRYENPFFLMEDDDSNFNMSIAKATFASISYKGDYHNSPIYMEKLLKFIKENNYSISGDAIEIYRVDIHISEDPDEFINEIQIPIDKNI